MSDKEKDLEMAEPREPQPPIQVVIVPESFSFPVIFRWLLITLMFLLAAGIVVSVVISLGSFLFFLVIAVLLAYFIAPLVNLIRRPFSRRGMESLMPRTLAIGLAYIIVFSALGVSISYLAPRVVSQGKEFGASLPAYAATIRHNLNDLNRRFDRLRVPEEIQTRINDQIMIVSQRITEGFSNFVFNLVTYLPWLIIVPVLSFFFLKDANLIRLAILRMFPAGRWRLRAEGVVTDINNTLFAYTRAQLISCLFIGTICTLGFYVIGLKYALLLGILAGVFEFVPFLGPLSIAIIVTSTAAFGEDPWRAVYVILFLGILRIFHDYVSYPKIVREGIQMHPLLIILSILAGEQAAGIPGVFIAIPLVAVLTVIYRHILDHQGKSRPLEHLAEVVEVKPEEQA
ncbi:MAG TPA: AI-2E family transporter [Pyrinomonadaceae bacterium]|nr:AI-2E family transporter [Pyrinomonadaceae bacterium]HMP65809.1 AI-2E family transporter [Pyrinomonadaceae bacterium]